MLLRSIRSRLLALVVATVIPFTALIGAGLWRQWQSDQVAAIEHNINEARILAAQIDDHIGNLDNRITQSNEDAAIVGSLIAMAHNLGLCALAKGVQSGEQARFLLREGCAEVQGHLTPARCAPRSSSCICRAATSHARTSPAARAAWAATCRNRRAGANCAALDGASPPCRRLRKGASSRPRNGQIE